MQIQSGSRIGRYEIAGIIAAGGMGEVYRARDTELHRDVAIKVLPERLSSDAGLRERFQREARAISSLTHPHICTLYDVGHQDGIDFLVMEYLAGESLADRIGRGRMAVDEIVRVGSEIAAAIAAAHRRGIVHRDLKPANIMLTSDGAKVLDFGLAVVWSDAGANDATEQRPLTRTGQVVGTLPYMSPEQLRGVPVDARTDIFSLGAIVYEMASGRHAFEGANRDDPPPVNPPALDVIVRRCLARDPATRFASADEVQVALDAIGKAETAKRPDRKPLVAAALAVAVVAAAAAVIFWNHRASAEPRPNTIAVLPFASLGTDGTQDYLRLAIPDEVTTLLTYNPDLAVRPFSASRLVAADTDPQIAAKKLNAAAVVSGQVMNQSGHLNVSLEAIDARQDKLLWRDSFEVGAGDMVAMRNELGTRIRGGLMPRLAGTGAPGGTAMPRSRDAYVLFLRAAALPDEGEPNAEAAQLLEQAVAIEPDYANAWAELSQRDYYATAYGTAGTAAKDRALEAATRALQLDPNSMLAACQLIVIRAERGDTVEAYRYARRLVDQRPRSGDAHFNLAYVLRYGGALDESARECNEALALDPGNRGFRSCVATFDALGDTARAADFARLDPGSTLMRRTASNEALRRNDPDAALREGLPLVVALVSAWRAHDEAALRRATDAYVARAAENDDGESFYGMAVTLAFAGRRDAALDMLKRAVDRNFCFYPAIDRNAVFAPMREMPEFAALRGRAVQCHDRFMAAIRG